MGLYPEEINFMYKALYVVPFVLMTGYFLLDPLKTKTIVPKINQARLILSELRGGDFTHAGDKEAIDMVLTKLKQDYPEIIKENCFGFLRLHSLQKFSIIPFYNIFWGSSWQHKCPHTRNIKIWKNSRHR